MGIEHYDANGDTEWACGGDADCNAVEAEPECADGYEHRWTSKGVGGCDSNPGVWSLGGTTLVFRERCVVCGVVKTETRFGSQRNPGQCDRVEFEEDEPDEDEQRVEMRRQDRNRRRRERRRAARLAAVAMVQVA